MDSNQKKKDRIKISKLKAKRTNIADFPMEDGKYGEFVILDMFHEGTLLHIDLREKCELLLTRPTSNLQFWNHIEIGVAYSFEIGKSHNKNGPIIGSIKNPRVAPIEVQRELANSKLVAAPSNDFKVKISRKVMIESTEEVEVSPINLSNDDLRTMSNEELIGTIKALQRIVRGK